MGQLNCIVTLFSYNTNRGYLRSGEYVVNTEVNLIRLIQFRLASLLLGEGGWGRGEWPSFQNPNPIYDQNLQFSLSYLQPVYDLTKNFDILFMT